MKVGQKIKLTLGSRAYNYVVAMQSEVKDAVWIKSARGRNKFLLNLNTLTWNENGSNLSASKIEC